MTLKQYEGFCSTNLKKQIEKRTLEGYLESLRKLQKSIGDKELSDYSVVDVESFRAKLSIAGLENSTINIHLRSLKALFNRALTLQLITSNPFKGVKLCKVHRTAPAYLSPEDLDKLLVHVRKKALRDIYTFLWHTGLRASELINLKWSEVDLNRGWMIITYSKSGKSRGVPLNSKAVAILSKFPAAARNGYVFKKKDGSQLKRTAISHSFKKAVRRAGLPEGLHLHSTRHSTASVGIMKGMDLSTVSKLLGHSSILITSNYYSHIADSHMAKSIELLAS